MPLFLDSHILPEGVVVTPTEAAELHARDLAVQDKYGVRYVKYWYDAARGRVFCLVVAPSREAAMAVHQEAHGVQPDDIFEVQEFE
jgi:Protein of unknown function (DUF4242)